MRTSICDTMEKLSYVMMPNPFHPANFDPNHKDYHRNGAVWQAGTGIGLTAAGAHQLRNYKDGARTFSDALASSKGANPKGIGSKLSALAKTKYGRLGLGIAGLGLGLTGMIQGTKNMMKTPEKDISKMRLGMHKIASPFLHPEVHKAMVDTHNNMLQREANKTLRDGILIGTGAGAGAGGIMAGIGKKLGKNISKTKFGLLTGAGALLGGTGLGLLSNRAANRFDQFKIPQPEE